MTIKEIVLGLENVDEYFKSGQKQLVIGGKDINSNYVNYILNNAKNLLSKYYYSGDDYKNISSKDYYEGLIKVFELLKKFENIEYKDQFGMKKKCLTISDCSSIFNNLKSKEILDTNNIFEDELYKIQKHMFEKYIELKDQKIENLKNERKAIEERNLNRKNLRFAKFENKRQLESNIKEYLYDLNRNSLVYFIKKADEKNDVEQILKIDTKRFAEELDLKEANDIVDSIQNSDLKKHFNKVLGTIKKEVFRGKVKDSKVILKSFAVGLILTSFLGLVHHIGIEVINGRRLNQDYLQIEENVETGLGISKFNAQAVLASQQDGKYYAEVFGMGIKDKNSIPEFCSLLYEIDKDTYERLYRYFDIKYKYGDVGQLVGAENKLRTDLEAYGTAKAKRARWDIIEDLADKFTKNKPEIVKWINGNTKNLSSDMESEM